MSLPVGICYNIRPSPYIFPFPTSGCRLKRPLRGERGESDFHQIPSCSRFSLEGDEKIKKAHHAISRSAPTIARKRVWEIVGVPFSSFFFGGGLEKESVERFVIRHPPLATDRSTFGFGRHPICLFFLSSSYVRTTTITLAS